MYVIEACIFCAVEYVSLLVLGSFLVPSRLRVSQLPKKDHGKQPPDLSHINSPVHNLCHNQHWCFLGWLSTYELIFLFDQAFLNQELDIVV
jgi:hypothetical protein